MTCWRILCLLGWCVSCLNYKTLGSELLLASKDVTPLCDRRCKKGMDFTYLCPKILSSSNCCIFIGSGNHIKVLLKQVSF